MRTIGLRDTWAGLVLVHSSFALPLTIWLLVGFIREIPREAEEAASVDGAGTLATLRWVVAPRLAPGIASTALLTFLFSWNEFLFAYTFTASEASRTIPVGRAAAWGAAGPGGGGLRRRTRPTRASPTRGSGEAARFSRNRPCAAH